MKEKLIRRELIEIVYPAMLNMSKFGTEEFQTSFDFKHKGRTFQVSKVHNHETNKVECLINDFYGIKVEFNFHHAELPIDDPRKESRYFAEVNQSLIKRAQAITKLNKGTQNV